MTPAPARTILVVAAGTELQDRASATTARLDHARRGLLGGGPETLQLNLTNACNLDCVFCWNHSPHVTPRPLAWHRQRLSDRHLDAVLADLERLRPGQLLLSGRGEPLLHPRVEELLERARALALPVTIQTNGGAGCEPERLAELQVARLLVNLSAASPAGYARIHPQRGHVFEAVLGRLRRLAALRRLRVTLTAVICRENVDEIEPLVALAEELSMPIYLKGMEWSRELEGLVLGPRDVGRVEQALRQVEARVARSSLEVDSVHLRAVVAAARRKSPSFSPAAGPRRCLMGWFYLRVTCEGALMFCCKDKPVGHLDQASLYSTWRSPRYQLWRLAGRDGDTSVGLFDEKCARCSNLAQNGALLRRYDADAQRGPSPSKRAAP